MDILSEITGKAVDQIFEASYDEASEDIKKVNYDIIEMLNLLGFDGEKYYNTIQKYK
jgi:transcriptional regulator